MADEFDETFSEPRIRASAVGDDRDRHVFGYACPFCGMEQLKLSYGDIWADRLRVELYCDNSRCDVREFVILAMRSEGETRGRSDVEALERIDERPIKDVRRKEQERTGKFAFHRARLPAPNAVMARRMGGVVVDVHLKRDRTPSDDAHA